MPKVAVMVKLPAAPGKGGDLVAAFEEAFQPGGIDSEPGTLVYAIHQGKDDPDTVYFYEMYEDEAALAAHSAGDVLKKVGPKLGGLIGGAPEMTHLVLKNGHGVPA